MADGQGWLPPWPQWCGDEVLAELTPDPGARQNGWPVTELASHHLAPVTDPDLVAGSLRDLLSQLQAAGARAA